MSSAEVVVEVAGRANLIGEYTDLNGGLVLPIALDGLTVRVRGQREGDVVELESAFGAPQRYVQAVVSALGDAGRPALPLRGRIEATLPPGAGLSSSAALTMAVALAVDGGHPPLCPAKLAQLCQRAENDYVGVPCGIMDQLAVGCARADHALLVNCSDLAMETVRFPDQLRVLIVHSGIERRVADGAYASLAKEFKEAASRLAVGDLCELQVNELDEASVALSPRLLRRLRHVVTENSRVGVFVAALRGDDRDTLGELLASSHASLRSDLEVSTPELDLLVDRLRDLPGAVGARLTGAGFGGCAIALIEGEPSADAVRLLVDDYRASTGRTARCWVTTPGDGIVSSDTGHGTPSQAAREP